MQQPREFKQFTVRAMLQQQDQQNLAQNGYNHMNYPQETNYQQQNQMINYNEYNNNNNNFQMNQNFMNQPIPNLCEMNNCNANEGKKEKKSSTDKVDLVPQEIYEIYKQYKSMKQNSTKALFKKWNLKCRDEEKKIKNSVKQYHKRQEVERRSLDFLKIKEQFYAQNKLKITPSSSDFGFFISSLNCYESNKTQLRLILNEQTKNISCLSNCEQLVPIEDIFFITLKNKNFTSLEELSLQMISENFQTQTFFDNLIQTLDFQNLKYLQISFSNLDSHLCLKGSSLSTFSYRLRRCCPDLSYLVLEFQEIDLEQNDFQQFSNNIEGLKNLSFIDLLFRNTPTITTEDIVILLKALTLNTKTHLELNFPNAQNIIMNEELYSIVSQILDMSKMYFLKSLILNFPVLFPPEKEHLQKQLMTKMNQQLFNNTPFLNNLELFVPIHKNAERLINLKSFNYQKIWIQLLKIRKLGLLNKFRKEISWELCEFQEIYIF